MAPSYIPEPGTAPNVPHDAKETYNTLKHGGVVIIPTDVGYALLTNTQAGIQRIFSAKDRRIGHNIGIIGIYKQHREIHVLSEAKVGMTRVLTEDVIIIIRIIAKYDTENLHPRLAILDPAMLSQVTKDDTVSITVPKDLFLRNSVAFGQRFRVEDIESRVINAVDLVVDYGLQKWQAYRRGGVNFDAENMKVLQKGAGYEVFHDRMLRWFPNLLKDAGVGIEEDPDFQTSEPGMPAT
ncbi:hypothetical protein ABHI18_007886 [Aspergillus niger]